MTTTNHNSNPSRKNYQDRILRPEFEHLRLNFPHGPTWLRILSPSGSGDGWRLPILAQEFPGGRYLHPATFDPERRSAFDIAHDWFRRFRPQMLRSRSNKRGYRLRPVQLCAFWAIEYSETGNHSLNLVLESFNDGVKGPTGLAHEIQHKITEKDENDRPMCDALHPENGVMICVERSKRQFVKAPLDWVRVGRVPRSVNDLFGKVRRKEMSALCLLEETLREPTVEEEWDYLGRLITPKLADEIRTYALRYRA
ncbi:hypothetical protein BH09VER1_BH09VER1_53190 [soil metagenome]